MPFDTDRHPARAFLWVIAIGILTFVLIMHEKCTLPNTKTR